VQWVKAFHIIFVISWYAGLLYLPRLFVYHASCDDEPGNARFKIMERKLFAMMTIGAVGSLCFGLWMLGDYAWSAWSGSWWLHAKLTLIVVLSAYHGWCGKLVADFRADRNVHSERFYRLFNEIPALIMIAIVILVVVKP
jgi:protoporphyrinogen IX oxidase